MDKVFAALPDDGVYSSGFAMVEMENGYAILVKATVDKAGTEDKPDPVTLESIKVTKNPKLEYWVGESFDPAGMVITATYSNNTTKDIDAALCSLIIDGTDATEYKFGSAGSYTVTISYGGQTTTVPVTVKEPEVKELKVEPSSLTFEAGAYFYPDQITKVTATYTYGSDKEINISECDLTLTLPNGSTASADDPYTFDTAGTYTLTVSYKGGTATVSITVTANSNGYYESGNNYVVTGSNGLQQLFTDKKDIGDFTGTITLTCDQTVTGRLTDTFKGILEGKEGSKPTITLTGSKGLFGTIRDGTVQNLAIDVTGTITAGAIADENYGSISNCTVTIQDGGSIQATATDTSDALTSACAGGIVGTNGGTIEHCDVTISGSITADASSTNWSFTEAHAGGIAGLNEGTIESSCSVELNCGSIQATATGTEDARTNACAGGIAGNDFSNGVECGPATGTGTIKATVTGTSSSSDGSVTLFLKGNTVAVDPDTIQPDSYGIYKDGYACAGTKTAS